MTTAKAPGSLTAPRLSCFNVLRMEPDELRLLDLAADDCEGRRRVSDGRFLRGGYGLADRAGDERGETRE